MAALLVGGIALGVDKIKQHRAERKEKGKAKAVHGSSATTEIDNKGHGEDDEQLPSYEGATSESTRPVRPGADRRGRRGYTQFHGSSNQASLHPLERDQQGTESALASVPENSKVTSNFVDDEKERLRRAYAERARPSDDGRRGRANPDLVDGQRPPGYLERAPGSFRDRRIPQSANMPLDERLQGEQNAAANTATAPPLPPSYEAVAGEQQK